MHKLTTWISHLIPTSTIDMLCCGRQAPPICGTAIQAPLYPNCLQKCLPFWRYRDRILGWPLAEGFLCYQFVRQRPKDYSVPSNFWLVQALTSSGVSWSYRGYSPNKNLPSSRKECLLKVPLADPQIQKAPLSLLLHKGSRPNGSLLLKQTSLPSFTAEHFSSTSLPRGINRSTLWTILCVFPAKQFSLWFGGSLALHWGHQSHSFPCPGW